MTEDILFDNIYLGHSLEDAKALATETFTVKKDLEAAANAAESAKEDKEDSEQIVFKEDPVAFIREKVFEFIDLAQIDPVFAAKSHPETAAGLALAILTFFGMLGVFVSSLFGGSSKPAVKVCAINLATTISDSCNSLPRRPMPPHPTTKQKRRLPLCRRLETRRRPMAASKRESKTVSLITYHRILDWVVAIVFFRI